MPNVVQLPLPGIGLSPVEMFAELHHIPADDVRAVHHAVYHPHELTSTQRAYAAALTLQFSAEARTAFRAFLRESHSFAYGLSLALTFHTLVMEGFKNATP